MGALTDSGYKLAVNALRLGPEVFVEHRGTSGRFSIFYKR